MTEVKTSSVPLPPVWETLAQPTCASFKKPKSLLLPQSVQKGSSFNRPKWSVWAREILKIWRPREEHRRTPYRRSDEQSTSCSNRYWLSYADRERSKNFLGKCGERQKRCTSHYSIRFLDFPMQHRW